VEKSGVDVEKLIELLVRNASAELTHILLLYHPEGKPHWP
jgi:ferritin-like protein